MSCRGGQSRTASFAESLANVAAGFLVALLTQQVLFPAFGIATTLMEHITIAVTFTALSVLRSYALRRIFERIGAGAANNSTACP